MIGVAANNGGRVGLWQRQAMHDGPRGPLRPSPLPLVGLGWGWGATRSVMRLARERGFAALWPLSRCIPHPLRDRQ